MTTSEELWVVTGAASGIGAAVVVAARARGARVAALDVQDAAGAALADEHGAHYIHCDVSSLADWEQASDLIGALGRPTHVHLNAGIQSAPPEAPLAEYTLAAMTEARYRKLMGVNVDGVVFGLRTLAPLLANPASIVVTCSLAGVTPYDIDPLYAMSKHAVTGFVRSMAPAMTEQGATINAICPGGIDTAIIPHEQRTPQAQFMTPEHIAEEVLWLMDQPETGKTWAKVATTKPLFIIRAPGDKSATAKPA